MIRMLVSVRNLDEACDAARSGVDLIDLEEPGAVRTRHVASMVRSIRAEFPHLPVCVVIGGLRPGDDAALGFRAAQAARCGADYVKAFVPADSASFHTAYRTLAYMRALHWNLVPVLLVDNGLDLRVAQHAAELRFPIVMLDTASKRRANLFQCVSLSVLDRMVQIVHAHGVMAGLAGGLLDRHVPLVRALGPDIAGFRTALCDRFRISRLSAVRMRDLHAQLAVPTHTVAPQTRDVVIDLSAQSVGA